MTACSRRPPAGGDRGSERAVQHVGIVVPVRDEAHRLEACLQALTVSARAAGAGRIELVVVDDGSMDGSERLARRVMCGSGLEHTVIGVRLACAGAARAVGSAHVAAGSIPASTVIMSTDADSVVPVDWIARHLAHHRRGAVAVAGTVSLSPDIDAEGIAQTWWSEYSTNFGVGWHPHVHGANLSVRLDAYLAVGGFRPVPRAEDIDLWTRLRAAGHTPVQDPTIVVETSARRTGRVRDGFAAALARLTAEPGDTTIQDCP